MKVKWHIHSHAISAFLTVMLMPLTYSIAYGLVGGIMSYAVMEGFFFVFSKVGISPPSYDEPSEDGEGEKTVEGKEEPAEEAPEAAAPAEEAEA